MLSLASAQGPRPLLTPSLLSWAGLTSWDPSLSEGGAAGGPAATGGVDGCGGSGGAEAAAAGTAVSVVNDADACIVSVQCATMGGALRAQRHVRMVVHAYVHDHIHAYAHAHEPTHPHTHRHAPPPHTPTPPPTHPLPTHPPTHTHLQRNVTYNGRPLLPGYLPGCITPHQLPPQGVLALDFTASKVGASWRDGTALHCTYWRDGTALGRRAVAMRTRAHCSASRAWYNASSRVRSTLRVC